LPKEGTEVFSRKRFQSLIALLLSGVALAVAPGQIGVASADPPLYLHWPDLVPTLIDQYVPDDSNVCVSGEPSCVDSIIAEMRSRFAPFGHSCSHQAVFSLAYLRVTQSYQWSTTQPGFYTDSHLINHEAAVFAKYYLGAFDNWQAGNYAAVPQAWKIAFDASNSKSVNGSGDLLLGINAHINRDLPFVLAAVGLTNPDGTSRKPDNSNVDKLLNMVTEPMSLELIARMDPTIVNLSAPPYGIGWSALFQLIAAWREEAWLNAQLLIAAPTPAARALVAQTIETAAATEANVIKLANAYVPPLTTTASRDTFCASHNALATTAAYPFGIPPAY
jgi:Family of unknown function (DUF5995)